MLKIIVYLKAMKTRFFWGPVFFKLQKLLIPKRIRYYILSQWLLELVSLDKIEITDEEFKKNILDTGGYTSMAEAVMFCKRKA